MIVQKTRQGHDRVAVVNPKIRVQNVSKQYGIGGNAIRTLENVNLSIEGGEFVTLVGPSGCGKSTLFNILAGLVPPDKDSKLSGPPSRLAQARAIDIVKAAGGNRVGIYDVENKSATPIYVHAKVCVIDDVWATVGSDNLNRRSWTHDSELSCAVIDSELDDRVPIDPGGLGDGSRRFARDLRLALWAEHLGRSDEDPALLDLTHGSVLWHETANELTSWQSMNGTGVRPPGRVRTHEVDPVPKSSRQWSEIAYRLIFDPDGRPLRFRVQRRF